MSCVNADSSFLPLSLAMDHISFLHLLVQMDNKLIYAEVMYVNGNGSLRNVMRT